jgi:epoxyqueuosine reductase
MTTFDLKSFIESQGWSFYGIAPIDEVKAALSRHRPVFDAWESAGYEADMDYLRRMAEDRFNPEHKLPGVKSAIVLASWYGYEQKMCSTKEGKVARYAGGRDYHKVLRKKLDALTEYLKQWNPLVMTYPSVDSGPTVDRVLAEAASLGFFGKNSCIIDPSKGSYFFIATLFTTMDLSATPKRQMPNCGNCTKCMDACPTGAIVKPGVIDARKCISYLTIENRGGIPEDLRPKIGNRLFGCDICQEVCPFTVGRAHTQTVKIETLTAEAGSGESLDLREILAIKTDAEFEKKFAGTPIMRAKRRGLLRNACVVAGNSGDRSLISFLDDFLQIETDPMLREHALWARGRLS